MIGIDVKKFYTFILKVAEEKNIPKEMIIEAIEVALATAYKKEYCGKKQTIKCSLNLKENKLEFYQAKLVVDPNSIIQIKQDQQKTDINSQSEDDIGQSTSKASSENNVEITEESEQLDKKIKFEAEKHIVFEDAIKINPKVQIGEYILFPLENKEGFGRISVQVARQMILQKIKQLEKAKIFNEYNKKQGEVVSGVVQRIEFGNIYVNIGKIIGILPREEQVATERFRMGQKIKVYVLKVDQDGRGVFVTLSRIYPKFISKLFELEVPELVSGQIEIKAIARDPGSRIKLTVSSINNNLDPVGSMVGQRGTRISCVIEELGDEKIDIIEYAEEPDKYIIQALSPAKILEVKITDSKQAIVKVANDQYPIAIGKNGQNIKLASELTGYKIDIIKEEIGRAHV